MKVFELKEAISQLQSLKREKFNRRVPVGDLLTERTDNAKAYGFGEGTTMYDSVVVLGDVKVGTNTWIGPNVILDGSGGLEVGGNCTICAGSQIYSHDSVRWAISGGKKPYDKSPTRIGDNCFIGPNAVISRGVTVGDGAIIGAMSFVNCDIPSGAKAFGVPAKLMQS